MTFENFIALLLSTGFGVSVGLLAFIAKQVFTMAKTLERMDAHIENHHSTLADHEGRLRKLEQGDAG